MEADLGIIIGVISFVAMLIAQTGAFFYWGGVISNTVKDHEKRIETLEELHPRDTG